MKPGRPRKKAEDMAVRCSITLHPATLANIRTYPRGELRRRIEKAFATPARPKELRWEDFA